MSRSPLNALLFGFSLLLGWQSVFAEEQAAAYLEQARAILNKAPLVDGHNDLPMVIRDEFGGNVEGHDISVPASHDTDIPRLRAGGVGNLLRAFGQVEKAAQRLQAERPPSLMNFEE